MALAENWTQSRGNTGTMGKYNTYVMHSVTNGHSECVVKTMSILFSKYNNATWAS